MKIKNLHTRLLLVLLPIILVVLSILSGVSYYLSAQALTKSVDDTAKAVGADYGNRIQADMTTMLAQLSELAASDAIRSGTDKAKIVSSMADIKARLGVFDVLAYVSLNGSSITNTGAASFSGDREYFKKVIATKKPAVSEPMIAKTTGKLVIILAVPVFTNDQLSGMVLANLTLDRMSDRIKDLKFLDSGYGQLADDSGLVIANPKQPEIVGKLNLTEKKINTELKLPEAELDDRLITLFKSTIETGVQSRGEYRFGNNAEMVAVCTPIPLPGDQKWVITVAAPAKEVTRPVNTLAYSMLTVSVLCLIIMLLAILFVAKKFAKPVSLIRDECMLLSQGDLRERELRIGTEDEIGQLAKGFQDMRKQLRDLIAKVHAQSEQLAASSEELTANSEQSAQVSNQIAKTIGDVAAGAVSQREAVNDASAVVEQMSASIQQIAANANQVAAQSAQASGKAKSGDVEVEKAVSQMQKIESTVTNSAQVVAKLGERSKEIGQIVDTISGIAGQTNLLALNAAIEAARAGEQGRGFAVVAEEVRKLAEQSQESAQKIADLIAEIQGETDRAVAAMNEGTEEVQVGAKVVNSAGSAFKEIMAVVDQVSNQVKEISAAIEQMAIGSQQIVNSVQKIDGLSKDTSVKTEGASATTEEQLASMEEIATSSQALAQLAQELQAAVSRFQI